MIQMRKMGLSITPKFNRVEDHVVEQIRKIAGGTTPSMEYWFNHFHRTIKFWHEAQTSEKYSRVDKSKHREWNNQGSTRWTTLNSARKKGAWQNNHDKRKRKKESKQGNKGCSEWFKWKRSTFVKQKRLFPNVVLHL